MVSSGRKHKSSIVLGMHDIAWQTIAVPASTSRWQHSRHFIRHEIVLPLMKTQKKNDIKKSVSYVTAPAMKIFTLEWREVRRETSGDNWDWSAVHSKASCVPVTSWWLQFRRYWDWTCCHTWCTWWLSCRMLSAAVAALWMITYTLRWYLAELKHDSHCARGDIKDYVRFGGYRIKKALTFFIWFRIRGGVQIFCAYSWWSCSGWW